MQLIQPTENSSPSFCVSSESLAEKVNKDELVRLLLQSLKDLDYHGSAKLLEQESGITLEPENVILFRQAILTGQWSNAETLLDSMSLAQPKQKTHIIFLIRQQRFLELLEKKKTLKALYILRTQLTPLAINMDRVHELSSLVLCSTPDDVKQQAQWDGADGKSRELLLVELQRHMLPAMIPRERMMTLLHQAFEWQRKGCLYHDSSEANYSLLSDHVCDKSHFPATTIRILKGHADEVWHLAFSHNGQYLASVSKDTTCTIWDVKTFDIKQVLRGVSNSSSYCEWSPDDSTLLMCGCDFTLRLWDPMTGELLQTFPKHEDQVTSCVWLPDGRHFLSGGCDKKIILWRVDGTLVNSWAVERILDMKMSHDGHRLVVVSYEKKISVYDFNPQHLNEVYQIAETEAITSLSLSRDGQYALVNVKESQELHLWHLEEKKMVRRYTGQKQEAYIIRSALGGVDESFVLSGSEDNCVYIWSREHQHLLEVLEGHTGVVNSVCWYPGTPVMFASASDDGTIRIWGIAKKNSPLPSTSSSSSSSLLLPLLPSEDVKGKVKV